MMSVEGAGDPDNGVYANEIEYFNPPQDFNNFSLHYNPQQKYQTKLLHSTLSNDKDNKAPSTQVQNYISTTRHSGFSRENRGAADLSSENEIVSNKLTLGNTIMKNSE